jgi:RimJ/RimL family protein N-acetyltransferase
MCVIDPASDIRPDSWNVIATPRLKLRRVRPADAEVVARLAADYAICSMSTRMPYPYGRDDAESFVRLISAQDRERENTFVIEHEGDGMVGVLGFHQPRGAPLELGYWIGRPYWGRGYATEATLGALNWARTDWRRKMVVAGHFADNPASGAVLVKAGFLYTGVVEHKPSVARGETAATRMMVWLA